MQRFTGSACLSWRFAIVPLNIPQFKISRIFSEKRKIVCSNGPVLLTSRVTIILQNEHCGLWSSPEKFLTARNHCQVWRPEKFFPLSCILPKFVIWILLLFSNLSWVLRIDSYPTPLTRYILTKKVSKKFISALDKSFDAG